MKTLVYENYNKFISATDTIRDMRSNVENMEEEMNRLAQNMDKITETTEYINNTLAPRRAKLQELSGVYRLLKKRQFLFELPTMLKQAVQMGSYSQAVINYNKTNGVLRKYSNVASFRSILTECHETIQSLIVLLREKIGPQTLLIEASESAGLLLDLGEPAEEIRSLFLNGPGSVLVSTLDQFEKEIQQYKVKIKERREQIALLAKSKKKETDISFDNPFAEDEEREKEEAERAKLEDQDKHELKEFLSRFHNSFLALFLKFCNSYELLFVAKPELTPSAKSQATKQLYDFGRGLFDRYLLLVTVRILQCKGSTENIIEGLGIVLKGLEAVDQQLPYLALSHVASDVINRTIQKLIQHCYNQTKTSIHELILSVSPMPDKGEPKSLSERRGQLFGNEACIHIAHSIIAQIEQFFNHLKLLFVFTPANSFLTAYSSMFFTKVVLNAQQLFLYINMQMAEFYEEVGTCLSVNKRTNIRPISALQLARVCVQLQSWGVPHVQKILANLSTLASQHPTDTSINTGDLQKRLMQSSRKLLAYYVKCQGSKISQMIRKAILTPNWLKAKEPREVRQAIEMMVDEIKQIAGEVEQVFDKEASSEAATDLRASSSISSGSRSRSRFELHIGNLFEKKVQIFGAVAADRDAILLALVRICLKSLLECARLQTFAGHGYRQLQLDLHYLALTLRPLASKDAPLFNRMLDDILSSAAERCLDPQPAMEPHIIEALCQHKLEQKKATTTSTAADVS